MIENFAHDHQLAVARGPIARARDHRSRDRGMSDFGKLAPRSRRHRCCFLGQRFEQRLAQQPLIIVRGIRERAIDIKQKKVHDKSGPSVVRGVDGVE